MKRAIFPGTFDPFTLGHLDILNRSKLIFDEVIIGIGKNDEKTSMFSIEKRIELIKSVINKEDKIEVMSYNGLTIDFCKKVKADFIVRGIRSAKWKTIDQAKDIKKKTFKNISIILKKYFKEV